MHAALARVWLWLLVRARRERRVRGVPLVVRVRVRLAAAAVLVAALRRRRAVVVVRGAAVGRAARGAGWRAVLRGATGVVRMRVAGCERREVVSRGVVHCVARRMDGNAGRWRGVHSGRTGRCVLLGVEWVLVGRRWGAWRGGHSGEALVEHAVGSVSGVRAWGQKHSRALHLHPADAQLRLEHLVVQLVVVLDDGEHGQQCWEDGLTASMSLTLRLSSLYLTWYFASSAPAAMPMGGLLRAGAAGAGDSMGAGSMLADVVPTVMFPFFADVPHT